jgi:glycerophosphodiester phosphodiesterase
MLWEAEDWKMDLYGIELNKFVDTTLQKVYSLGGQRASAT